MKSFKKFMTENGGHVKSLGGDGGAQNQYGRWGQEPVHLGVHRIEDPNVLQRLNAHVGLINTREYIDPRSALEHVQNALMRLGYHFEYNMNEMPNEENVYPLNRWGGRKGFIDMDAVVKEDDGIEASVGESMVLRVEFVQDSDTSRYEVFAQIVPASLFDEEDVQPEAIKPNRASVPSTTGDAEGMDMGESIEIEEIGEAVSISMAHEKGQGTFEVTFDFRGGPTKKQAQKFALAAQKRLAGASFTPNRKGTSEKVVVTVKAGSPREAQVKARKVLDENVSIEHVTEAQKFIVSFPSKTLRNQALADVQKLPSGLRTVASALFPGAGPANGVFFSVSDNGTQTRDLMKLIKKARGTVSSQKVEEIVNEELSRTFAFPTSDARDRIEKLLGLASREPVTTSNKGKGKLKFTVTAMLKSPQIAKIINSVKQLKGIVSVPTTESTFAEISERLRLDRQPVQPQYSVDEAAELSRTFAFPTSDARDRIEKLFGLATGNRATTSDKGKGKFKFTVTGMLKGAQIDRIMNAVKQLKGKLAEETTADMANNAVHAAIRDRAKQVNEASAFIEAGLKHARSAVGGGKQFVSVSGKMSEKKASQTIRGAAKFLKQHGTPADKKLAAKVLGESVEKRSAKAKAALAKAAKRLTPKQQVAMKLMREGVQILPGLKRTFIERGSQKTRFTVEVVFTTDDWKGPLADAVRKALKKANPKGKTTDRSRDKTIIVALVAKDMEQALKRVGDLVSDVRKKIGVNEDHDLSHDDNAKENRRTRKDNKLASGFKEQLSKKKKKTTSY